MSSLRVEIVKIDNTEVHPNADALDLLTIKGWTVVEKKNRFKVGDLVVYFPIDSVLPRELSDKLGCTQYLVNQRIRAARLRGVVSCGLLGPNEGNWDLDTDLTEHYGVTKWEPPAPKNFSTGGQNRSQPGLFHYYTGIENWNNYNYVFEEGEEVVICEKLHGSNQRMGIIEGEFVVGSHYNAKTMDDKNVYWQAALKYDAEKALRILPEGHNWIVFGEVFGAIQDLRYGLNKEIDMRIFDISKDGTYLDYDDLVGYARQMGMPVVPELYRGPYSLNVLHELHQGKTTFGEVHIKEGVVIRPVKERWHPKLHRVILKKINPEYLVRKNGTEFH